ncbi:MAG: D-aminoacyl-tRNA deacylase [Candidatus Bathyarchaeia archaeon]
MILIAASTKDPASINISRKILSNYPFSQASEKAYTAEISGQKVELRILDEELVYAQDIVKLYPTLDLIIFISRHSSLSGTPTLSVHTPGNLGEADLGGIPRKVSIAPANAMKTALCTMASLVEEKNLNYKVSYECTHHGPSLDTPVMFAELGSTPREWEDLEAAEAVAHATMKAVENFSQQESIAVLGVGGPHYNEKFTKMALESDIAFGHMIPKYATAKIDEAILRHCVERTLERVEFAILDWKGIKGEDKPNIVNLLNNIGLKFQKV